MFRLYDFHDSGNGYKVRLLLAQLAIPYEYVEVDILAGKSRTPEFLEKNVNGRIPLLELEDGRRLAESNAILFYLAEGTPLLPVYSAMVSPAPLGILDFAGFTVVVGATLIEAVADQQLRAHILTRKGHEDILATGLWKYSRHPNYFGETSFWWGLALFGLAAEPHLWSIAGATAMTAMFVFVSVPLLDERSAARRPGYREHMKKVSALVPLPPRAAAS